MTLIDKFEGIVLNNARRIISFAIFVLLLMAFWNLFGGILNTIDGPNVEADDTPRMPKFEEPLIISSSESEKDDEDEEEAQEVDIVESDFARELDKLASIHAPLYVASGRIDDVESANESLRVYIKDEVERLVYSLQYTDSQKEAWVDGYVDFSEDFKDYIVDKYDWSFRNPVFDVDQEIDSIDNAYLDYPVEEYRIAVNEVYTDLKDDAAEAMVTSAENNVKGATQLMQVGIVLGIVILCILILLIFKAENSLRRSADSSEKS